MILKILCLFRQQKLIKLNGCGRVQIQGTAKRKSLKTKSVTVKPLKIFKDQKWFLRVLFNHIMITLLKD